MVLSLTLAVWNVCSLLDNPRSSLPEPRTALVAGELAHYKVEIAALSETRFSEKSQLEEVGAGYTFLCSGRPKAKRRNARRLCHPERHRGTTALSAAGHQRLPDEPPPASPGRPLRHHSQCLRSPDDQP
ncbi:hypothetical protein SprV_0501908600 [Sparganum proliferum]